MTSQPPFALFVLDENIDIEYLNRSLKLAHDWDANATWDLWVATNSYEDMPAAPGERQPPPEATKPPLENSFKSPWIGKTVEDCAVWLQNAPDNSGVEREYFTAMNRFSREDDTVLTCRVRSGSSRVEVGYYPLATADISMYMITNRGSRFDEAGYTYQARVRRDGKPDRSQGGPFY
ncbi:hypothetical protein P171DRAFT_414795 [Karstenula rhodostoma CBS 690.94]|uniref:Uncharacterized protein n=1 Tax=Karstenula rhodostoma CBS 690.94 TaxID=1392251 RepID=A0A9P4PFU9_9PLEO|nr:hypothetical protein P171DRAFT_414795 [Karstenula rhodostoma CBS 690.94]